MTGTMHGFDIVERAPIARAAVQAGIDFLRQIFAEKGCASDFQYISVQPR